MTFHENVGGRSEVKGPVPAGVAVEVDHHTSLTTGQVPEQHSVGVAVGADRARGRPPAQRVAAGRFDLGDLRAGSLQQLGAIGPGDPIGKVQDLDARQGKQRAGAHITASG